MKKLRIYVDTSVIGGCLDSEFSSESQALLRMAKDGNATLIVSDILVDELELAPEEVQKELASMPPEALEAVTSTMESTRLRNAYLEAGVVGKTHENDAHHVALATVARADVIVSWNFKHIVHLDKIRGFNAVNVREGYPLIDIRSPKEVA